MVFDGSTVVEGWAKSDKKYHANYIYTEDAMLMFSGGICVGSSTSVLEKFFNARLYDVSAEDGFLGHMNEILPNDDVLSPGVLVSYQSGVIVSISARDNFVPNDAVPLVPQLSSIKEFVNEKVSDISQMREYFLHIAPQQNYRDIHNNFDVPRTTTSMTYGAIAGLFLGGVIISVLLCLIVIKFSRGEQMSISKIEEEIIDAEFVDDEDN